MITETTTDEPVNESPNLNDESVTVERSMDDILREYNQSKTEQPSSETNQETPEQNSDEIPIADGPKKRGRKPGQKNKPKEDANEIDSAFISGAVFLLFVDLLFPELIAYVNNIRSSVKVSADDIRIKPEQKPTVEPLADQAMKALKWRMHPAVILGITMFGCYSMNLLAAKAAKEHEAEQEGKID